MNGAIPNQQQYPTQPVEQQRTLPINGSKNKVGFGILFIVIVIIFFIGILNYFNILPLSKLLPNYLGFLPQRDVPTGTSQQSNNVAISPTDQAKQTLTSFLPTVLTASFLPQSSSNIKFDQDKKLKDNFNAFWVTKEGIAAANFHTSDSKKISSLYFQFEIIKTASPSVELAKSTINQVFNIEPKGEWGCKPWVNNNRQFCENFWTESDNIKRGIGFVIMTTTASTRSRLIYSFCEHSKEEPITYSWKSCRSEFAQTGVQ